MGIPGNPYGMTSTMENGVVTTINGRATNQGGGGGGSHGGGSAVPSRTDFLKVKENKNKALAGLEVEMAQQAMEDGDKASQRAASVLTGGGGREVGGGAFSRLRGRRNGVSLGGLLTGGLAGANRAKLAATKKAAIEKGSAAEFETLARSHNGSMSGTDLNKLVTSGGINDVGQRGGRM